jgi:hypothetical protein
MPLAWLVVVTLITYPVGLAVGSPWLLPALNAAPAYLALVARLRAGDRRGAVVAVLVWALALALFGVTAFALWPNDPGSLVLNGPAYREEMFLWIRTGEGSEGSVRLFLPQHLLHLGAFVILCLLSASAAGILMGAVLMNYMSYYVASLGRAGVPGWAVVLLGWQPWAICRVAAFCVLGAILAEPLLSRLRSYRYPGLHAARPFLAWAAAGLVSDCVLKAALAPIWRTLLSPLLP